MLVQHQTNTIEFPLGGQTPGIPIINKFPLQGDFVLLNLHDFSLKLLGQKPITKIDYREQLVKIFKTLYYVN